MALTTAVRAPKLILLTAATHGANPADVAARAGFDLALLERSDTRVPLEIVDALWQEASRATGIEAIGVAAAELAQPGMFDVLDYAVRASSNPADALERLVRINRLEHDTSTFSLERAGGRARVVNSFGIAGPPGRPFAEFTLAVLLVVTRQCTGVNFMPVETYIQGPPPKDFAPYAKMFGPDVRFQKNENALVVEESVMSLPFGRADSGLVAVLERHAEALLAAMPPLEAPLSLRVRHALAHELRGGDPSIGGIARKLSLSERSLQRKLGTEGATFDAILDSLRAELAQRYLTDMRLSIGEIAFLLGYAETSAFHRAFRRWTGQTPGEHRTSAPNLPISAAAEEPAPRSTRRPPRT